MLGDETGTGLHSSRPDAPGELQWLYPNDIVQMLQGIAGVLGLDLVRDHGRPPPNRHYRDIIAGLVRPLFVENAPEQIPDIFWALPAHDRAYFVYLLRTALIDILAQRASLPKIPLGVPDDKFGTWSNLLARSWLPLPLNLRYRLR